jgi:hypothetical protein
VVVVGPMATLLWAQQQQSISFWGWGQNGECAEEMVTKERPALGQKGDELVGQKMGVRRQNNWPKGVGQTNPFPAGGGEEPHPLPHPGLSHFSQRQHKG